MAPVGGRHGENRVGPPDAEIFHQAVPEVASEPSSSMNLESILNLNCSLKINY